MNDKVKLYQMINPYVTQVSRHIYLNDFSIKEWENQKQGKESTQNSSQLALELPVRLKWLLVAAYIASNNPPNHDGRYFGDNSKRKGKRSVNSKIRRRFTMPSTFVVERMIAIYFAIYEQQTVGMGNMGNVGDEKHGRTPTYDTELFTQIQTLISLSLLTSSSKKGAIESVKLRCNISYDFIKTVAKSLDFDLNKYLQDA